MSLASGGRSIRSILLLAFALVACGSPSAGHRNRVLLVGVDGMEWDVVLPLLHEGKLPNLAKAMSSGSYGLLESTKPNYSPIIWTSVATGKVEDKHGILGFVHKEADPPRLYTNRDRTTKAIWNILTDEDRRVAVVGWWMTFPVEEINGVMVAQTNTLPDDEEGEADKFWKGVLYEDIPGQVHPPELQKHLFSVVADVEAKMPELTARIFGERPDESFDRVAAAMWEAGLWSLRADEIYRRAALQLLKEQAPFDLFAVYFGGPDVLGHRFWRYLHPELYEHPPTEEQVRAYGPILPAYYMHIDRIVGELLAASPPDTDLVLLSDHGMTGTRRAVEITPDSPVRALRSGGHRQAPPGVFVASGPDILSGAVAKSVGELTRDDLPQVGGVLDITPTLLAILGLPLAHDMDGEVMTSVTAARPTRWVESHTPDGWAAARAQTVETPMSEERLEQLRSLGYLGGGDDD